MDYFQQTIYWLIAGSKGGKSRISILKEIEKKPANLNEIAKRTGMNYKTAQHHIELMEKNGLITKIGNKYGQIYFYSEKLKENAELLKKMITEQNDKEGKKHEKQD
jgi:DNA-binding MarR family transcriptional regulator